MTATRIVSLVVFASLVPVVAAQQAAALYDAPLVAFPDDIAVDAIPDLNGDGIADAVGWWTTGSGAEVRVSGYVGDGAGGYQLAFSYLDNQNGTLDTTATEVGHFDSDNRGDFATWFGRIVTVNVSDTAGAPQVYARWDEGGTAGDLAVGDFDGNGLDDLALASPDGVRVQLNTGNGFVPTNARWAPGSIHVGELDGDGVDDLIHSAGVSFQLLFVKNGQLVVGPALVHGFPNWGNDVHPVIGDIDGDGDDDVVAFADTGEYIVFRRTGPTSFAQEPKVAGGPATDLYDIDGDGDLDGCCCSSGGSPKPYNEIASIFHLSINDGSGSFAPAWQIPAIGSRRFAGATDVDGDGDVDLVAGRSVYYSRGWTRPPQPGSIVPVPAWHVADVDRDGDPDLELAMGQVWTSDGEGRFQPRTPLMPSAPAGTVFWGPGYRGDFDGDGDVDLIVGHRRGTTFLSMRLLVNNGGGGFTDGGPATHAGVAFERLSTYAHGPLALVGDLDDDGDQDLVVRESGGQVWHNDGLGHFQPAQQLAPGEMPWGLAHLDGDRWLDLVVYKGALAVAWGSPDGVFSASGSGQPMLAYGDDRVAVGDFDGNGFLDLCAIDMSTNEPLLLSNQGGRSFAATVLSNALTTTRNRNHQAFADDIDGDGTTDLIVQPARNSQERVAWILRGDANGGLRPPMAQVLQVAELADVDGDGDLDAMAGDRLVRNARFHGGSDRRRQFGQSQVGMGNMAPTLGASGPFRVGHRPVLHLTGTPGGTVTSWAFSSSAANRPDFPFKGMIGYAYPLITAIPFVVGGAPGEPGVGSLHLPYDVNASFAGVKLVHQVHVLDPTAPWSLCYTNGLEVSYGQ